jgi:hypothetical protein
LFSSFHERLVHINVFLAVGGLDMQMNGAALASIVPDLTTLHREPLKRCQHALDLDVPAGPHLAVGFLPARWASHSVYVADPHRAWSAEQPLEHAYYLLVTASAEPGQAYRQAVRLHWERFGRPAQAHAARQQLGTPWPRKPMVAFRRADPARRYRLIVNGSPVGVFSGTELEQAVPVPVTKGR